MAESGRRFHRIDGGYAWIVVVASLLNNIIMFGSTKSGGVYLVALNVNYGVSKAKAAFIGITSFGTMYATGVFASGFVNRYGSRPVQVFGACIAFIGVFSSHFVTNPDLLILTFGAIQGIGFGICTLPNSIIISHYFKKYSAAANGIGLSGGPLGSFLLPPLIEYLVEEYGLRGTYLIMSGVVLHLVVFSSLMIEPPHSSSGDSKTISNIQKDKDHEREKGAVEKFTEDKEATIIPLVDASEENKPKIDKNELNNGLGEVEKGETETLVRGEDSGAVIPSVKYYPADDAVVYRPTVEEHKPDSNFKKDFIKVLKNGYTYLLILNVTVTSISIISYHITVPTYSIAVGANLRKAAFIISMSSVADFFSRFLLGYFIDRKFIPVSASYMLSCFTETIAFLIMAFAGRTSYAAIMGASVMYGGTYGVLRIHQPIMKTHYVGLRYLTITMGLSSIASALFSFIISPIANEFMNHYGTYMGLYFVCAAVYFFNGFVWAIVALQERNTARKQVK